MTFDHFIKSLISIGYGFGFFQNIAESFKILFPLLIMKDLKKQTE